jgi:hypothetical protein
MPTFLKTAKREFAVVDLDVAVLERIHDAWDAEDYDGMLLFLDEWAPMITFETAKELINSFELEEELGDPATIEERYDHVDDVFYDIEDALNRGDIKTLNRRSGIAKVGGPEYAAGRDGLKFGLIFHASSADLEDLRERFPKKSVDTEPTVEKSEDEEMAEEISEAAQEVEEELGKAASVVVAAPPPYPPAWCMQKAINLIKSVDFGYGKDAGIIGLEQADHLLDTCELPNGNLKMAIRYFLTDRHRSREFIYGTESGSNVGALSELINSVELPVAASAKVSRFVTFRGALYELVPPTVEALERTEEFASKVHEAYHLPPGKMKGVKTCTPKDQNDKKPKGEQVWCVFDSHGKLRARYKTETEAKRYKVFMISRYWSSGKGKKRSDRPTNK